MPAARPRRSGWPSLTSLASSGDHLWLVDTPMMQAGRRTWPSWWPSGPCRGTGTAGCPTAGRPTRSWASGSASSGRPRRGWMPPVTRAQASRRSEWPSWTSSVSTGAHLMVQAGMRCGPSWWPSRPCRSTGTAGCPQAGRPTRSWQVGHQAAGGQEEAGRRPPEPEDHEGAGGQAGPAQLRVETSWRAAMIVRSEACAVL